MKMKSLAGAALVITSALAFSAYAQQLQIADSTGGHQVAGAPIAAAISTVNAAAANAQNTANWSGVVAQSAQQTANNASNTANDARNRAVDARARADYTAWYNWNYTRATAISNCMATGGNPVYCTVAADSMYPAP